MGSGVEEIAEKLPENIQRVSADLFANKRLEVSASGRQSRSKGPEKEGTT